MLDDRVGADEKEFFDIIDRSGQRLIRTVHEILDMSQMDTQSYNLNINEFDLSLIVQQAITELTPRIKEKNLTIDFYSEIKNPILVADEYCITQAVSNIIDNAIKFTPENGDITVSVRRSGKSAVVEVADTGAGMPEDVVDRLFRLGEATSTMGTGGETGTGLGLHLCKDLVERQGGQMDVESKVGEGSVFRFTLPLTSL